MKTRLIGVLSVCFALAHSSRAQSLEPPAPSPVSKPGARVVTVHDAKASEAYKPDPAVVRAMVDRAVIHLTGKTNVAEAWKSLISSKDVVGVKVHSAAGPNSGTRPAVAAAVIEGLIESGLPPRQIIVWDQSVADLRLAGYFAFEERYGVRVTSSAAAGYDEKAFYDTALLGNLVWGDLEFGKRGEGIGRKSYVSKLLTGEIAKIINITPLLNHNYAGVAGCLYTLTMSSVDNSLRFEHDAARLANAVPEIYALPEIGDRVALSIVDALICQYQGGELSRLHYSAALNELRFSRDPVALDVLSIEELERQRQRVTATAIKPNLELYQNASLLQLGISDPKQIVVERVEPLAPGLKPDQR